MNWNVACTALLLAGAFAGCLDGNDTPVADVPPVLDEISQKVFDVIGPEITWVTSSDGKRMHNAVYRPDTSDAVPVFINFSPYWGSTAETRGDNFAQYMIDEYVPRGYAVVLSAVRGTGHSEGCFQIAGDREVEDLYDVVDYFANADWSSGNVAAGGKSYDSTTQNGMIAKMPHEALKGIFHVSGITDMYRYNYKDGVPYVNGVAFTPRYYATQAIDEGPQAGETADTPEWLARTIDDVACPEAIRHVVSGTGSAVHGLKDDYWIERDWNRYIGDSSWNGSIFFYHGFQDWNVKPDHILPWIQNLPDDVRVKGWLHQDKENGGHLYPMRTDWNATMLGWLDTVLKGKEVGFWDGPAWDLEGTDGTWRAVADWPPVETLRMEPTSISTANGVTTATFDVASYSANATGYTRITGAPLFHVTATSAVPDPVLTAVMYVDDVWVGEAVLRGIYRNGLDLPEPVIPVIEGEYTLDAYPLDLVLAPGQALEVRFGEAALRSITAPLSGVTYVEETLRMEASIVSANARAAQPTPMPCFAC